MRQNKKAIALERIRILVNEASHNIATDAGLASRQAATARKLQMHHRVKMPYELRMAFCRKCKSFIGYGTLSRIRVYPKSVNVTCKLCGHVNRKILPQ